MSCTNCGAKVEATEGSGTLTVTIAVDVGTQQYQITTEQELCDKCITPGMDAAMKIAREVIRNIEK